MDIELMPLDAVCSPFWGLLPVRSTRAHSDDVATFAHHMGLEQPKPSPVVMAEAKAKPAMAGLGIVAGDRVGGIGFCDA